MQYSRHVARTLHDEHLATLTMLEKLEGLLRRHPRDQPPDANGVELKNFLSNFVSTVRQEMTPHFRFEEDELFPLLAARGEADIGGLLTEEHATILPVGERMATLANTGRREGFQAPAWSEFHQLGNELIERLTSHVHKEEMALVPMLEDLLEDQDDSRLLEVYAMNR
jgi:iron-sulfur cluster repair protein YtfE (RIC family)